MIDVHTLLTVKYILYRSGCIVYMFLGTDNQLIRLILDISVTMTTCTPIRWGISVCPVWYLWWPHGQEFTDLFGAEAGPGVGSGWWISVGVHLIMTSLDEGEIQCLDQSDFNIICAVPTKPTYCFWYHRAWIHNHLHVHTVTSTLCYVSLLACVFWLKTFSEYTALPVGAF